MIGLATPFRIAFRIWTNEAVGVRAVREEKRREEEIRSEKRKSQKKEDEGARKGRKVAKQCIFQCSGAPEGLKVSSKSRFAIFQRTLTLIIFSRILWPEIFGPQWGWGNPHPISSGVAMRSCRPNNGLMTIS